jgi:hypothetical protein
VFYENGTSVVDNCQVTLANSTNNYQTTTGPAGWAFKWYGYSPSYLTPGAYTVSGVCGNQTGSMAVTVVSGRNTANLTLKCPPALPHAEGMLEIRTVDDNGAPIEGAMVSINDTAFDLTGPMGWAYHWVEFPKYEGSCYTGTYDIVASKDGYTTNDTQSVTVVKDERARVIIVLHKLPPAIPPTQYGFLEIQTICGINGTPLAGANVTINNSTWSIKDTTGPMGWAYHWGLTEGEGKIAVGTYHIEATYGPASGNGTAVVTKDNRTKVIIKLYCNKTMPGEPSVTPTPTCTCTPTATPTATPTCTVKPKPSCKPGDNGNHYGWYKHMSINQGGMSNICFIFMEGSKPTFIVYGSPMLPKRVQFDPLMWNKFVLNPDYTPEL